MISFLHTGTAFMVIVQFHGRLVRQYSVTNMISRLGIVETRKYNVEYRDGTKSKGDKIGMPCTHSTVI